jgi:hydrogenase-4 membrane subunit HyfE
MVLWILAAILVAFWVMGLALKVTTGLIHIALVAALVLFVLGFFRGRSSASAP